MKNDTNNFVIPHSSPYGLRKILLTHSTLPTFLLLLFSLFPIKIKQHSRFSQQLMRHVMIEKYSELAEKHFSSLSLARDQNMVQESFLMMLFTNAIINFTHKHTSELILSHNETTTAVTRHQNHRLSLLCNYSFNHHHQRDHVYSVIIDSISEIFCPTAQNLIE